MRCLARAGTWCTNPTRSWFESLNPMPRPTPLSKNEAEREKLNVIMHWYWFQMFTMRFSRSSSDVSTYLSRRLSHIAFSSAKAASTASTVAKRLIVSRAFVLLTRVTSDACDEMSSPRRLRSMSSAENFSSCPFSTYPRRKTKSFASPGSSSTLI